MSVIQTQMKLVSVRSNFNSSTELMRQFEALARLTPISGYGLGKFCGYIVGDPFSLLARVASAQDGFGDHVR
jgi:hypothetical protein